MFPLCKIRCPLNFFFFNAIVFFFLMCGMSFCIFMTIKMIDELKNNIISIINEIESSLYENVLEN